MKKSYRNWWQTPRRAGDYVDQRRVSFLELFFDLVYVALIAQVSHNFVSNFTMRGAIHFISLFTIVWWSWLNGSIYHDLHSNNDIKSRIYTFLQMTFVIVLSTFTDGALQSKFVGFAICYSMFQLMLSFMWWRTGVHDIEHRPLSTPYVILLVVNAILFGTAIFFERRNAYFMWGAAMLISVLMPLSSFIISKKSPTVRKQLELTTSPKASLIERMGLLTIIVMGEIVVAIVVSTSKNPTSVSSIIKMLLFIMTAVGIWWLYFDFISHRKYKNSILNSYSWMYLHLPLTMGIVAYGVSTYHVISIQSQEISTLSQCIFLCSMQLILTCIYLIICLLEKINNIDAKAQRIMLVSSILYIPLYFIPLHIFSLLIISNIILYIPIVYTFILWTRTLSSEAKLEEQSAS